MEQKKLIKEFPNKSWGLRDCKNYGKAAALKAYRISLVFYSVIFIHKLDIIKKENVIWLQIFSAAILPYIIEIGQHLTGNHKHKKGELFETQCSCNKYVKEIR